MPNCYKYVFHVAAYYLFVKNNGIMERRDTETYIFSLHWAELLQFKTVFDVD